MTKFILGLLAYTGMVFGNTDIIMRDTNSDLCLSFSNSEAMVAFDPVNGTTNNYPSAMWVSCNSTDEEFQLTTDNQIVGPGGRCLTILPIDDVFHVNLDSCDTWTNLPGAGSYLFHVECQSPPVQSQQWTYDSGSKEFTSFCPHGLSLSAVGNSTAGFAAFVSDDTNTFNTVHVMSGMTLQTTITENIMQEKSHAVSQILSILLESEDHTTLQTHGCWCSKIMGTNPDYVGEAIDSIDKECKNWNAARHCIALQDGSCFQYDNSVSTYVIQIGDAGHSCTHQDNSNFCLIDSCQVDAYYANKIAVLLDPIEFLGNVTSSETCSKGNGGGGGGDTSPASNTTIIQKCSGTVPNDLVIIHEEQNK